MLGFWHLAVEAPYSCFALSQTADSPKALSTQRRRQLATGPPGVAFDAKSACNTVYARQPGQNVVLVQHRVPVLVEDGIRCNCCCDSRLHAAGWASGGPDGIACALDVGQSPRQ